MTFTIPSIFKINEITDFIIHDIWFYALNFFIGTIFEMTFTNKIFIIVSGIKTQGQIG